MNLVRSGEERREEKRRSNPQMWGGGDQGCQRWDGERGEERERGEK
jgi:hypothetical protein